MTINQKVPLIFGATNAVKLKRNAEQSQRKARREEKKRIALKIV